VRLPRPGHPAEDGIRAVWLLLPGTLLVAIGPKLLAAFVFVDFRFPAFLQ
jgi:hypothetical protein